MQALDVPSGSAFRLRSGEQYPSSYSRRGLEDQSHQHKAQRLAASRSTKESFDGHEVSSQDSHNAGLAVRIGTAKG